MVYVIKSSIDNIRVVRIVYFEIGYNGPIVKKGEKLLFSCPANEFDGFVVEHGDNTTHFPSDILTNMI